MTNPVSEWILKASQFAEPVVEVASKAKNLPQKINWLLLGCALQQRISLAELQCFLTESQKEIGDIAELPAPSENLILSIISRCGLKEWNLAPQVAGIVYSVGRFARARDNRLDLWVQSHSPADIWRACGEIFYMGKSNPLRPKALIFLHRLAWLSRIGTGELPPFPNSAGARRWLIQAKIYDPDENPKEKLKTANSLYRELCPKNPRLAWHALQFFAEPLGDGYFCQRIFPCKLCSVNRHCRWWR